MRNLFLLIPILFLYSPAASPQEEGLLNKLLAPGPLIEGHKNLEGKDCLKCHEAGKGLSDTKCLNCHKEIKPFVTSKKGFHGLTTQTCTQCHSDHKGRAHDTTLVDIKTFDHFKSTGYALEGKHAKIKCQECHTGKRVNKPIRPKDIRFLGTNASTCISCHKKDDIHFYKGEIAKKDCNACHGNISWKENIKFNHSTDTKYKLVEKHAELKCNDCHLIDKKKKVFQYQWPQLSQKQCLNCHQDFHKSRLSAKYSKGDCTKCHTQTKWGIPSFDHDVTGYKLKGKHFELKCIDCHKPSSALIQNAKTTKQAIAIKQLNFTGLKQQCLSCHQDPHRFEKSSNPKLADIKNCSKCHEESSWKKIHFFDHNTETKFVIDGKHSDLKCAECHLPKQAGAKQVRTTSKTLTLQLKKPTYHWSQLNLKTCETCHKNPHLTEFSKDLLKKKCTTCHTAEDWYQQKTDSGFDHNKTRFQLTGAHKQARCNDCHGEAGKKKFKFAAVDLKFCIECHNNIHEGQFKSKLTTKDCSQCHSTEKFSPLLKFDHNQTNYQLKGSHETLKCSECHTASTQKYTLTWPNFKTKNHQEKSLITSSIFHFPNLKSNSCRQCHEDYHKGQLGQNCSNCHNEKSWKTVSFDHNKQSNYPLRGKHADLKCEKCHLPTGEKVIFKKESRTVIKYKPLSNQCFDCHKDPHKGNFGKSCHECHSEKSWKSTKDFHKNFTLSGVHYSLECGECHKDGKKLAGLSQQCIGCHQKDDIHNGSQPNCKNCHTQQFWEVTSFRHSLTRFPLRGAHRVIECSECHISGIYKGLSNTCVSCHLSDFNANPTPHTSGNTNCTDCHRNTFTFSSAN